MMEDSTDKIKAMGDVRVLGKTKKEFEMSKLVRPKSIRTITFSSCKL